jgi:hypothetical protein
MSPATCNPGICLRAPESSPVMPSARYSVVESPPMFSIGNTASVNSSTGGVAPGELRFAIQTPAAMTATVSTPMTARMCEGALRCPSSRVFFLTSSPATRAASPVTRGADVPLATPPIVSSARTSSSALCGRDSGAFSMLRMTRSANAPGRAALRCATCAGISVTCAATMACGDRPAKGDAPVSNSYATIPHA